MERTTSWHLLDGLIGKPPRLPVEPSPRTVSWGRSPETTRNSRGSSFPAEAFCRRRTFETLRAKAANDAPPSHLRAAASGRGYGARPRPRARVRGEAPTGRSRIKGMTSQTETIA